MGKYVVVSPFKVAVIERLTPRDAVTQLAEGRVMPREAALWPDPSLLPADFIVYKWVEGVDEALASLGCDVDREDYCKANLSLIGEYLLAQP